MAWRIDIDEAALKDLAQLDKMVSRRILAFLRDRLAPLENPRSIGEALKGIKLGEFWKYRVGDYRIIAKILDQEVVVLVIRFGLRREIYR